MLGVPPTMAKTLHDFAAAEAVQQLLEEEAEEQQQQHDADLDGQDELQEQDGPEQPSWEVNMQQALDTFDFEMFQASYEEEQLEMKRAAAAQLAASAQCHPAAGLAGSTDRSHRGRRLSSRDSDLQQTEGGDPPLSLTHDAGAQADLLPLVNGDEADPELQAPQRLHKRQRACSNDQCGDHNHSSQAAAAAASGPPLPPSQLHIARPAAAAALSEMQHGPAAPASSAAARAEADEAAATGSLGSGRCIFEANASRSSAPAAAGGSPTGQQLQQTGNTTPSADHDNGLGHQKQPCPGSHNGDKGDAMGQHSLQLRHGSHAAVLQQQWTPQELAPQQRQEAELHQRHMQEEYREWLQQQQDAHAALHKGQQQQQLNGATSAPAAAESSKQPIAGLPSVPRQRQLLEQCCVKLKPCHLNAVPAEEVAVWGQNGQYVCAKYKKDTIAWGAVEPLNRLSLMLSARLCWSCKNASC